MQLQCPALLEGNEMPRKYTCDGDNISPPLTWQDPPDGTRTFALIVEDPDAPDTVFTHWLGVRHAGGTAGTSRRGNSFAGAGCQST